MIYVVTRNRRQEVSVFGPFTSDAECNAAINTEVPARGIGAIVAETHLDGTVSFQDALEWQDEQ